MAVEIIPAVLPKSFKDLEKRLGVVRPEFSGSKMAQIDVVDGVFARNRTWPYRDESTFAKIVEEEKGLPFWEEFDFQFDLMIDHPETRFMEFVHAGASHIILHSRSEGALNAFENLVDLRQEGGAFSVKVGVALLPTAQPDELEPFEAQFDFVQVMGIDKIGYQGEPFDKHALYLIERMRKRYPSLTIQVDGGVSMENANALAKAGANRLVAGSAIFGQDDPIQAIADLRAEANRI
jgi:ribulose-phosphate 3-epimerase